MIKAVIDTNVIVSAYITKNLEAATSKVLEAVMQCKLIPIFNDQILTSILKYCIARNLAFQRILSNGYWTKLSPMEFVVSA